MVRNLLATKLYVPPLRGALVARPRLLARLDEALPRDGVWQRRLTLISAPAGYGKTTLAAAWIAAGELPVAWLTLDAADNDRESFLAYLFAALERVALGEPVQAPDLPAQAEAPFSLPGTPALVHFLNTAAACAHPVVLVLDDYHLIHDSAIHEAVTYLLTNLPPQLHLLLATRADPPLPLSRLRGQGQMTELRQADLRFTPAEARAFFAEAVSPTVNAVDVETLARRTEGWAAGLQMAAMALQGSAGQAPQAVHRFVENFAGTHRHILDYLLEEVLEQQPAEVQSFLLHTSILEALSAALCSAVLGDSGDSERAQAMLSYLEEVNLFVISLDDRRCWYRYHRLFADLLRARLEQEQPQLLPELYRRAALWYETQGMLTEALPAALSAGDVDLVARLAERNVLGLMEHGDVTLLARWLDALPANALASRRWLRLAQGWVLAYAGRLEEALLAADEVTAGVEPDELDVGRWPGYGAALRAYVAWLQGEQTEACNLARHALVALPAKERAVRCLVAATLGNAQHEIGMLDDAGQAFEQALALAAHLPSGHLPLFAAGSMAYHLLGLGQLQQAAAICDEALAAAGGRAPFGRELPVLALVHALRGTVDVHWYRLDEALAHTRRALALARQWGQVDMLTLSTVNLTGALSARGQFAEAYVRIGQMRQLIVRMGSPWFERILTHAELVVALGQGDLARAGALFDRLDVSAGDSFDYYHCTDYRLLATYLLARGEPASARPVLDRLLPLVEAAGARTELVKVLLLQARSAAVAEEARAALSRALRLAAPESCLFPFVDAGPALVPLLKGSARAVTPAFTDQILALVGEGAAPPVPARTVSLVEPLSERELDVLQLLSVGRSNREIGLALSISLATVKWHASNIYGKLNVGNRTEAVVRAQQLGLLP